MAFKENSNSSFILTDPYEPDGRGGGKLIKFPNRKDDDMTPEELDLKIDQLADVVDSLKDVVVANAESHDVDVSDIGVKWDEHEEMLNKHDAKVDKIADAIQKFSPACDAIAATCDVRHAQLEELGGKVHLALEDGKAAIAKVEANRVTHEVWANGTDTAINQLQAKDKIAEEMRGDVALCKSGIRDLDAIRDAFTQSAKGFSERVAVLEESFAAFQTLRHHDDTATDEDGKPQAIDADPDGAPGVDSMV